MRLQEAECYYSHPLARAYITDWPSVSDFFEYNPKQPQDMRERLEHLLAKSSNKLCQVARVLRDYNLDLGCDSKTISNIELLAKGQAVAVVTGQQPGIFTGPLYTIYKALGTVILARELSKELNYPVVPVFWIGADDHDFEETNHIFVPTSQGPERISIVDKPRGRVSLGHIPVTQEVAKAIQRLKEITPPIGWQEDGLSLLKETALASENLADWFGRLMTYLFRDWGLVLINPVMRSVRQLSREVFYKAIRLAPAIDGQLQDSTKEINNRLFSPQVQGEEGKAHLFLYVNGERQALYVKDGRFCNRQGSMSWDAEELASLALNNPEMFSPDVILRPIVQETLLPVLAYMGGPGEIGYYAQLKNIFKQFNEKMPIIYPRPNITLVEPLIAKLIKKYEIPIEQTCQGLEVFIKQYLEKSDTVGISARFNEFRGVLMENHRKLVKEISSIDPSLKALGQENVKRLGRLVNTFEDKVNQRHRRKNLEAVRQLNKLEHMFYPCGQWQERVYNVFPYLMKYQVTLLREIHDSINVFDWRQKILFFD